MLCVTKPGFRSAKPASMHACSLGVAQVLRTRDGTGQLGRAMRRTHMTTLRKGLGVLGAIGQADCAITAVLCMVRVPLMVSCSSSCLFPLACYRVSS